MNRPLEERLGICEGIIPASDKERHAFFIQYPNLCAPELGRVAVVSNSCYYCPYFYRLKDQPYCIKKHEG